MILQSFIYGTIFFLMLLVGDGWKMIVHKPLEVEVGDKRPKVLCVWSGMIG